MPGGVERVLNAIKAGCVGVPGIARRIGISEAKVRTYTTRLRHRGYITSRRAVCDSCGGRHTVYRLVTR